ncbi:hypothetical protein ACHAXA_010344 [Cyclostephanos tholiformis]|uniref:Uncharacterized protein n=1 Tax=Cyclostephanos tholiformis TaxID=382380 RepID=A0ABD3RSW2_9STRA
MSRLSSAFSWQFLAWLGIDHFAMNGGTMPLLWSVSLPLFKELGIDASRQQLYTTMMTSPFALKPFVGAASDLFPIRGYNKRYLALCSILVGCLGSSAMLAIYHSGSASIAISNGPRAVEGLADMIVISFFAMSLEVAILDVLAEGTFSGIMRRHPESGSSIISYRTAVGCFGAIVTKCYVGPLSDAGNFHAIFWIAFALSIAPLWPTFSGWLPEKKRSADEDGMSRICPGVMFHGGLYRKKKMPFIAIAASGLAAPIVSAVTTYSDLGVGLICSGFILLALAVLTYAVFPCSFFRITLGLMFGTLCQVRTNSALSYFYTADRDCLPNGPQFSYTFFITATGIVGSMMHFCAVIIYQNFLSSWKFRNSLIFSIIIRSFASVVDLVLVMRWNIMLGVPDKLLFFMGHATFENLVIILQSITLSSIYAKIAPPSMETAGFGRLRKISYSAGIGTFCYIITNVLGSGIIMWSGITTVGKDCKFDDLPYLIVVYQILVPLAVGIPSALFIPNVLQSEHLIEWEKENWYEDESDNGDQTPDSEDETNFDGQVLLRAN